MKSETEFQPLEQAIARRREQALLRRDYGRLLLRVAVLGLTVWVLASQVFLVTQATGSGMFPAVKDGDLVLGFRLQSSYVQGDVAVYTVGGRRCIGRIAAVAGDTVTLDGSGTLLVNGSPQIGEILYPTYPLEGLPYPLEIPEGQVFLLGDYRTQTRDSRIWGPVPLEDVQAKVITIVRRRGL